MCVCVAKRCCGQPEQELRKRFKKHNLPHTSGSQYCKEGKINFRNLSEETRWRKADGGTARWGWVEALLWTADGSSGGTGRLGRNQLYMEEPFWLWMGLSCTQHLPLWLWIDISCTWNCSDDSCTLATLTKITGRGWGRGRGGGGETERRETWTGREEKQGESLTQILLYCFGVHP